MIAVSLCIHGTLVQWAASEVPILFAAEIACHLPCHVGFLSALEVIIEDTSRIFHDAYMGGPVFVHSYLVNLSRF